VRLTRSQSPCQWPQQHHGLWHRLALQSIKRFVRATCRSVTSGCSRRSAVIHSTWIASDHSGVYSPCIARYISTLRNIRCDDHAGSRRTIGARSNDTQGGNGVPAIYLLSATFSALDASAQHWLLQNPHGVPKYLIAQFGTFNLAHLGDTVQRQLDVMIA
jgi:hypothetical protein